MWLYLFCQENGCYKLGKLCRVCGAIRSERNSKYYKSVDFASELESVFNIGTADNKN